ncbi:lipid II flippase family protein [Flavobacterium sp. CF136]|uniref:lipid II flippase family protein n=1 Tax=Flavobacterium sp. (strain CF136) TaxID=1144313 RepID=UPI000271B945|nr:DUF2837 family protein [Flavobacterium sp. CF136]EJL62394.1 hypothetical protein PMI10_02933 [Flavobacterium sp. CF136]
MNNNLVLVCILTLVIHFISIISLSSKIVGTRTRRVASSASIFNIIALTAQFSSSIQAPLLTKSIENTIISGFQPNEFLFRSIIFCATLGCTLGAFAIPTTHRFMAKGVKSLYENNSIIGVLMKSFRKKTYYHFKESVSLPRKENFTRLTQYKDLYLKLIFMNVLVYSFITVSVLSCLYAGYLNPNLRTTSLSLSGIAVGLGSVGMLLFIEPYHGTLTDKVIDGTVKESYFRRHLTYIILARILGTILGQFLYIPLAWVIVSIAEKL